MKKIGCILLSIVTIILGIIGGSITVNAASSDKYEWQYIYYDGIKPVVHISKYVGNDSEITIPDEIDGAPVVNICNFAFDECENVKSITIGRNIKNIEEYAFTHNVWLEEINVSEDNNKYSSEDGVLFDKRKIFLLKYPSQKKDVVYNVPKTATCLYFDSFEGCTNLKTLNLLDGETDIYTQFNGCSNLTEINVLNKNPKYSSYNGQLYDNKKETYYLCPPGVPGVFYDFTKTVTKINFSAFAPCEKLRCVIIPNTVKEIDYRAFFLCPNLKRIYIPDSVKVIEEEIFGYIATGDDVVKMDDCIIYGAKGSEAERYAIENDIKFIEGKIEPFVIGDSDKNGQIDIVDATINMQYLAELVPQQSVNQIAADVNNDLINDIVDVTTTQKSLAHLTNIDGTVPYDETNPLNPK